MIRIRLIRNVTPPHTLQLRQLALNTTPILSRFSPPRGKKQACSGAVRAIRFNPQEFLLAVATSDRTVKLYDIEFMELFCITAPDTSPTRQEYDPTYILIC